MENTSKKINKIIDLINNSFFTPQENKLLLQKIITTIIVNNDPVDNSHTVRVAFCMGDRIVPCYDVYKSYNIDIALDILFNDLKNNDKLQDTFKIYKELLLKIRDNEMETDLSKVLLDYEIDVIISNKVDMIKDMLREINRMLYVNHSVSDIQFQLELVIDAIDRLHYLLNGTTCPSKNNSLFTHVSKEAYNKIPIRDLKVLLDAKPKQIVEKLEIMHDKVKKIVIDNENSWVDVYYNLNCVNELLCNMKDLQELVEI